MKVYTWLKQLWFITFLVTLGCFLFTYLYYGFYYVEYEALFDSFYSGSLTEGMPFRSIYFLGNIGTSHVYSWLYQYVPGVEWISWLLYLYLFISCFLGLYIAGSLANKRFSLLIIIPLQIALYFLVFADHNIHFIFTRVSYIVTGVSLIALLHFFSEPGSIKLRLGLFIFLNLWFVLGVLTRSESATAVVLQLLVFGLFYLQSFKRFVILFSFPFIFLLCVLGGIAIDLKTSRDYYKQVEPEIEAQFCERKNIVPLSDMQTARDSAMWKAAKNILWADPEVLTPSYLRSLIRNNGLPYSDLVQWKRVYNDMSDIVGRFWHLALMALLLAILLVIERKNSIRFRLGFWIVYLVSFGVLIALQTYTVKVNDRSFSPLISLYIFCSLFYILHFKNRLSTLSRLIGIAGFVLFICHLGYLNKESLQLRSDLKEYRRNLAAITNLARGKLLVVNSSSCDYLFSSNEPFRPFDFSTFSKVYITDGFNIPFLPYYRRYLEKECKCDIADFPSFWDYLRTQRNQVVIISTTERMNILREYLRVIKRYNLSIQENTDAGLLQLQKSDARVIFADLRIYYLNS